MKTIVSIIILYFASCNLILSQSSYDRFYEKHKDEEGIKSLDMSPSVLKFFLNKKDKDTREALNKVRNITVFSADSASQKLIDDLKFNLTGSAYKDIMQIKDGKSTVSFKMKGSSRNIEEILMTVVDTNSLFVLCISGNFNYPEAKGLAGSINAENALSMNK